jgi:hypothetical protein
MESAFYGLFRANAATDRITMTAHGLANGTLLVLQAKDPAQAVELYNGFPYYVVNTAANDFQLAYSPGGSPIVFSTDVTSDFIAVLFTEISGGTPAYARKAVAFPSATAGLSVAASVTFDIPVGASPAALAVFTARTHRRALCR